MTKRGTLYYPMWLAYATGVLEKEGFEVRLLDAPAQSEDIGDVMDFVKHFQPRMTFLDTSTPSIYNDVKVAAGIKELLPGCITVLVDPHVSARPRKPLPSTGPST